MIKVGLLIVVMVYLLVSTTGCGNVAKVSAAATTGTLTVSPLTPTISKGVATQMQALLQTEATAPQDVTSTATWQSSAPELTVTQGLASCSSLGTFTVIVTLKALSTSAKVTCSMPSISAPAPDFLSMTPVAPALTQGVSTQMHAIRTSSTGASEDVTSTATWTTSSADLTITNGLALCSRPGEFTITAEHKTLSSSTKAICSVPAAAVTRLHISNPIAIVRSDAGHIFTVLADYSDGTTKDVSSLVQWSTGSSAATVTASGLVACNTYGETSVVATLDNTSSSSSFTCILKRAASPVGFAEHSVKFDGPFPSYLNIKTVYGAKGDGVTDDTKAFQAALDDASAQYRVLWIPAGQYIISQTLHALKTQSFTIIGEDPRTTIIKWKGVAGGTMMSFDGSTGFRLTRVSWDGMNAAGVGIHIASSFKDGQLYPTFDALEDEQISNLGIGVQLGFAGETTVNRIHFSHNTTAGISLEDWDALNFNVIDSLFTDCKVGVTNGLGSGAYNVSNSVFVRSAVADMIMGNTQAFSIRQNISMDSQAFFTSLGNGGTANITFQGNVIINTHDAPIQIANPGPISVIDNYFDVKDPSLPILLGTGPFTPTGVFSLGNTFTASRPFQGNLGRVNSINEAAYATVPALQVTIPQEVYTPETSNRVVFEVPVGATADTIQGVVNQAALSESGAVVHFPAGSYNISSTVEIPDVASLYLVGDGMVSGLLGTQLLAGPVMHVKGTAHLDALKINPARSGQGLVIDVEDKPSTTVSCDLCHTYDSSTAISISGLDEATTSFRATTIDALKDALTVKGGANQAQAIGTFGHVDAFMTTADFYNVNNGGHLLMQDGFHDNGQGPRQFIVSGASVVTHQGGAINVGTASAMQATEFTGRVGLLGVGTNARLTLDASSTGHALVAGSQLYNDSEPMSSDSTRAMVMKSANYTTTNFGAPSPIADSSSDEAEIEHMFAQTRTEFVVPRLASQANGTVVALHRLLVAGGSVGISIQAKSSARHNASYTIAPVGSAGTAVQSCPAGSIPMGGFWSVEQGVDGFVGLKNGQSVLSSTSVGTGGTLGLTGTSSMLDAQQRWFVRPVGNGLFTILNRANGSAVTRTSVGCATLQPDSSVATQEWALDVAQ